MATGTSTNFSITGGAWSGYTAVVDDAPTTASSGVLVNNLRQWEWDIQQGSTYYSTGTDHMIYFIPGTTTSNGEWWQQGSTPVLGTRSGTTITLGSVAVFDETDAFSGAIPSTGGGTSTEGVAVESGSLTLVNGDVVYVVDSTSITHTYYLKIDGVFAGGLHSNWQHTSGTQSGGTFPNAQDGKYTLEYEESASPFNHVKIAELTVGRKKVFCNFW